VVQNGNLGGLDYVGCHTWVSSGREVPGLTHPLDTQYLDQLEEVLPLVPLRGTFHPSADTGGLVQCWPGLADRRQVIQRRG